MTFPSIVQQNLQSKFRMFLTGTIDQCTNTGTNSEFWILIFLLPEWHATLFSKRHLFVFGLVP